MLYDIYQFRYSVVLKAVRYTLPGPYFVIGSIWFLLKIAWKEQPNSLLFCTRRMNTFEGVSESTIQTYNTEIKQVVIFVMTITDSVELFSLVFHICTYQNKQTTLTCFERKSPAKKKKKSICKIWQYIQSSYPLTLKERFLSSISTRMDIKYKQ